MKFIKRKKQGFTLIEVAIGLTIGSMLIGAVYSMVISSLRNTSTNEVRQTSALFTQQIMEELKGSTVKFDADNNMTFENLDNVEADGSNWKAEKDGYKAQIEISKNLVTIGEKDSNNTEADDSEIFCSTVTINNDFSINDGDESLRESEEENPIVINIVATINVSNKFEISFRNKYDKEIFIDKCIDEDRDGSIMLNLDLEKCDLSKNIKVNVFNHTDKKLSLISYKDEKLNVEINNKVGQISILDNQSNSTDEYTQLYDITIKVSKNGKEILKTESSQNLNVNMVGD